MVIPEEHKRTIKALVEADPEVAQATCDIPHLDPTSYLREAYSWESETLPYCGCFVGVYAWMEACKHGDDPCFHGAVPTIVSDATKIPGRTVRDFAGWCSTVPKDHLAVRYARGLLGEMSGKP